jgi:hypothetical protein
VVAALQRSGRVDYLPRGLLLRAWCRALAGDTDGGRIDLDAAEDIADRGPMRLLLADVHLHRARLSRDRAALERAREVSDRCGYGRRQRELADATEAATRWG